MSQFCHVNPTVSSTSYFCKYAGVPAYFHEVGWLCEHWQNAIANNIMFAYVTSAILHACQTITSSSFRITINFAITQYLQYSILFICGIILCHDMRFPSCHSRNARVDLRVAPGILIGAALTATLQQPIKVVSILMQLGHEPVPPRESYSFIYRQYFKYYSLFGYIHGICRERGFLGLYRGLLPTVIQHVVKAVVNYCS